MWARSTALCCVLCAALSAARADDEAPSVPHTAAAAAPALSDVDDAVVLSGESESGQCRRVRQAFARWERARVRTMGPRARPAIAKRREEVNVLLVRHRCEGTVRHRCEGSATTSHLDALLTLPLQQPPWVVPLQPTQNPPAPISLLRVAQAHT